MPDSPPRGRPAVPHDPMPPPHDWRADVGRETARLVAECRAVAPHRPGIDASIRRRVLDVAWDVFHGRSDLPGCSVASGRIFDGRFYRRPPAERFRLVLACHSVDWSDGATRLAFLAEVVRSLDLSLGR